MDGGRGGSEYINSMPPQNRRKKIEIISTNKVESFKRQNYQYLNPYSLNRNPSTPFLHRTPTTPESLSHRDNLTETSSQKSGKVVRANGLSKAEKPNISHSRAVSRPLVQKVNTARIGPAFSSGYSEPDHSSPVQQQYGLKPSSPYPPQQGPSIEEHLRLKQQNARLREQLMRMERNHGEEINGLKEQIERIFRLAAELEERIKGQDREWEAWCKDHQHGFQK